MSAVDFLSKILTSWLGQFSRHLAAVSAVVFYLLTKVLQLCRIAVKNPTFLSYLQHSASVGVVDFLTIIID